MDHTIEIQTLRPRRLAAVRRRAAPKDVPNVFKPALDEVWAFLSRHPGLRTDGHNVFLYHHVNEPDGSMLIDFGVEVSRTFEPDGEVRCIETPPGEAAVLVHRGRYSELPAAHAALHGWFETNGKRIGAYSLEVYGDPQPDPSATETTIEYLIA